DNVELLHEAIRQLARQDDSLSREAEKLEAAIGVEDAIGSSTFAAGISAAIAAAVQFGMDSVFNAASGLADASSSGATGGALNSGQQAVKDLSDPTVIAERTGSGSLLSGAFE